MDIAPLQGARRERRIVKRGNNNSLGGAPLGGSDAKMQSWWHRFFGAISINAIVLKNCGSKTWKWLGESCAGRGQH